MLGVHLLVVPGIVVFAAGVALQTAAVSSVSGVKLSTQIVGAVLNGGCVGPGEKDA